MSNNQNDVPTTIYNLVYEWKMHLFDKADLLEDKDGKVAILLKSKKLGDPTAILLDILEESIRIHALPHFVDNLSISLI